MIATESKEAIFALDDFGLVIVEKRKETLVNELLKHMAPQWKAQVSREGGVSEADAVISRTKELLTSLNVEHEFHPYPTFIAVMGGKSGQDGDPAVSPVSASKPAFTPVREPPLEIQLGQQGDGDLPD